MCIPFNWCPDPYSSSICADIPLEIRKRGKQAIKIYKDALSHGQMRIPHVKLVILGEARHGKTSLLKLLEGLEFEPNRDSTEGHRV